jgi:dihydroorotate dehydrogenase
LSLYGLARPLLFALDPETAHRLTLRLSGLLSYPAVPSQPLRVMGLEFPNPVGLAAGLDKNAEHIDAMARMGFGFIEVGTVTPRAQAGNPKPRLFRLVEKNALINRFGFNNVGVDEFLRNVAGARWKGVLGINLGKNADTPPERAVDDYAIGLEKVYASASYVTINISSPNTRNLRDLQQDAQLNALLERLAALKETLADRHGKRVPIALKIAPDLEDLQVQAIADALRRHRFDALIATNTSTGREGVEDLHAGEAGGLSGAPLRDLALARLRDFRRATGGALALIAAGGIANAEDAWARIRAGASLVQLYTALVFDGPGLARRIVEGIDAIRAREGFASVEEAVGTE